MEKPDFVKIECQKSKELLPKDIVKFWNQEIYRLLKKTFLILNQVEIDPISA